MGNRPSNPLPPPPAAAAAAPRAHAALHALCLVNTNPPRKLRIKYNQSSVVKIKFPPWQPTKDGASVAGCCAVLHAVRWE